ncbi:MAG: transposase [Gemmatimonadota bacterium]|nr:transposase [Gemmatimonadota bacterium]
MERKSIRRRGFDYRLPGPYFVTLVSAQRLPRFGVVCRGRVVLTEAGQIVATRWLTIRSIDPDVWLDEFIVMPDHFHAIVGLQGGSMGVPSAPPGRFVRPARSLGSLIAQFKATTTRLINQSIEGNRRPVWQRNYYERIIRNQPELERIRRYIITNPKRP